MEKELETLIEQLANQVASFPPPVFGAVYGPGGRRISSVTIMSSERAAEVSAADGFVERTAQRLMLADGFDAKTEADILATAFERRAQMARQLEEDSQRWPKPLVFPEWALKAESDLEQASVLRAFATQED